MDVDEVEKSEDWLSCMPPEIWSRFFSYLEPNDLNAVSQVSRVCKQMGRERVTSISLDERPVSNDWFKSLIFSYPNIQRLHMANPGRLGRSETLSIATLANLKHLSIMDVSKIMERQALFFSLFHLRRLESLELGFGKFSKIDIEDDLLAMEDANNRRMDFGVPQPDDFQIEEFLLNDDGNEEVEQAVRTIAHWTRQQLDDFNFYGAPPVPVAETFTDAYSAQFEMLEQIYYEMDFEKMVVVQKGIEPLDGRIFDVDVAPMINLTALTHLALHNVPIFWNARQEMVLSFIGKHLETMEISYRIPPTNLDFLAHSPKLRKLRLVCSSPTPLNVRNQRDRLQEENFGRIDPPLHAQGLVYSLPVLPKLEQLAVPQWCVESESLKRQTSLRMLSCTPWGWKRADLCAFGYIPSLQHLEMKVNWLPSGDFLERSFRHLYSLTIVDFDVSRLPTLRRLRHLRILVIDAPTCAGRAPAPHELAPVAALLRKLPQLIGFSLINVPHFSSEIREAILSPVSRIRILEISGCITCVQDFIDQANKTKTQAFTELTVHVDHSVYKWKSGQKTFNLSNSCHSAYDFLERRLY